MDLLIAAAPEAAHEPSFVPFFKQNIWKALFSTAASIYVFIFKQSKGGGVVRSLKNIRAFK